MERTVKTSPTILLTPGSAGWRVARGQQIQQFPGLAEAVAEIPQDATVHLSLPTRMVLFERMRLPSTDPAEVTDMARLQLEKTMPFSLDEVLTDFEVLHRDENESDLLAVAVHQPPVDELTTPLIQRKQWPERVNAFVRHAAAVFSTDAHVLIVYRELDMIVCAICDHGKINQVQLVSPDDLQHELPAFLLSAELEGISVHFDRICLDEHCEEFRSILAELVPVPVNIVSLDHVSEAASGDLLPSSWREERKRSERGARLKTYLLMAAGAWVLLILLGALWLGWLQWRTNRMLNEVARLQPDLEFVQSRQARWNELAPAIDRSLYAVEILRLIQESNPSPDLRFTQFDQSPTQFSVQGEAPSAGLAVEFLQRLRDNPGLKQFSFDDIKPTLLPNEHAQFQVFGKR